MWWDITMTKVATTMGDQPHPGVVICRPDGTTRSSKGGGRLRVIDAFTTMATDHFAGWYVTGTRHTAPAIEHVRVYQRLRCRCVAVRLGRRDRRQ